MSVDTKPVIFLAFAHDPERPLPKLVEEERALRQILQQAAAYRLSDGRVGLCEVVILSRATIADILNTFQLHRNRIAVFHYGGHANGYALLLESATGASAIANADGLAEFLAQQAGLEVVFLNGCATQQQAQGLLEAGVSVVIATSHAIKDAVATDFATRFYHGLINNASIYTAFKEAESGIEVAYGSDVRDFYAPATLRKVEEQRLDSPWELFYHPDHHEVVKAWTLGQLVDEPFFGLPPLPTMDLPPQPFRHLDYFRREHAHIFFGRGYQVRAMYKAIEAKDGAPILLLYGQSGVGKSSFLAAGLLPRLERDYQVAYCRRDQSKGLPGALREVLGLTEDAQSFAQCWHGLEVAVDKPLIIVLDQIEEFYTRPNPQSPQEMTAFLDALQAIFGDRDQRPRGKLILSFRKEWLAEIEKLLRENNLPFTNLFLERLDRRGVINAVTCVARDPRLQEHYHLTVSEDLPEEIADDLLADRGSAVATTLQILLTKLWERAKERSYDHPIFDQELYHELRSEGLLLSDFFDQQLAVLRESQLEVVDLGLALDFLVRHTTPQNTAEECTLATLLETYQHRASLLPGLVRQCQDLYLLTDPADNQPHKEPTSRLAHDTLAPLVRSRFATSDKPGQRARRILENRAAEWQAGQAGTPLDRRDLALVEQGMMGMRIWNQDEKRLIQSSQRTRIRQKWFRWTSVGAFVLALLIIGAVWQARQAQAFARSVEEVRRQADQALQQITIDPIKSILISQAVLPSEAVTKPYVPYAEFALNQAIHANLERRYLRATTSPLTEDEFAFGETHIAVADSALIFLVSYDLDQSKTITLTGHLAPVVAIQWDKRGQTLLSSDQKSVRLWRDGVEIARYAPLDEPVLACAIWQPTGDQIALCADNKLILWSAVTHSVIDVYTFPSPLVMASWSPDGQWLTAWDKQQSFLIWNAQTGELRRFQEKAHAKRIRAAAWAGNNAHVVTVTNDGELHIWSVEDETADRAIKHKRGLVGAKFIDHNQFVTWGGVSDTARLWSVAGNPVRWFGSEADAVQEVQFTAQGMLTFLDNGDVQLWDLATGSRLALFRGHNRRVLAAVWRGQRLATASVDGTARVWEIDLSQQGVRGEFIVKKDPVTLHGHHNAPDDTRADVLGIRWQDEQHLLTIGHDGSLRLWQVYDEQGLPLCGGVDSDGYPRCFNQSRVVAVGSGPIVAAQWVDNDTVIATDRTAIFSATISSKQPYTLPLANLPEVVWSLDGNQLLTYSRIVTETPAIVQELQTGVEITQVAGPIASAFSLDGGWLVNRPLHDALFIDPETITPFPQWHRDACAGAEFCALTAAAWHTPSGQLAATDDKGMIYLWNGRSQEAALTARLNHANACQQGQDDIETIAAELPINELHWFKDGNRLLAAGRQIGLWNTSRGEALWCYPDVGVKTHIAVSPDERLIAATFDRTFAILDAQTGQLLWSNQDHDEPILGLQWAQGSAWQHASRATLPIIDTIMRWLREGQWSDNGQRLFLLTWSGDGTARLWHWNGERGTEILRLSSTTSDDPINVAAVNADGTAIFTATYLGVVRIWPVWLAEPEKALDPTLSTRSSERLLPTFP